MQTCEHCGVKTPNMSLHFDVAHKKQEEAKKVSLQAERNVLATNNVLVVYEEIPSSLKVYNLKVTGEELKKLQECHNDLIDSTEQEESWVFNFLKNFTPGYNSDFGSNALSVSGETTVICTGTMADETGDSLVEKALNAFGASGCGDDEEDDFEDSDEDEDEEDNG